uniref:Uncharacterized protein n=1 Tax=Rhizophora mucronata TaxID=61149 RepID=A0A2P2NZ92_RHIMU
MHVRLLLIMFSNASSSQVILIECFVGSLRV